MTLRWVDTHQGWLGMNDSGVVTGGITRVSASEYSARFVAVPNKLADTLGTYKTAQAAKDAVDSAVRSMIRK